MQYTNTHKDIVEACMRSDKKGQMELYRLYSKGMFNICLRMLNNREDAEDMLQNVFLEVFSKLDRFRFESSIGAWIRRITVNRCINFLKRRRIDFVPIEDRQLPNMTIEPRFEANDFNLTKIKKAIPLLPDGYRVVFSLYMLEGYDHREIASILGINESTSKSQLNRAKKKLKTIIHNNQQNNANARPA